MGARKDRLLERVLFAYTVYFKARAMRSCCNLLQKKTVCFVVITDGFWKINPHLEAKQAATLFTLREKRKNIWNKWGTLIFYCEKQSLIKHLITWATSVFYFLGLSWAKRLTWKSKYSLANQTKTCGCLRGNWT